MEVATTDLNKALSDDFCHAKPKLFVLVNVLAVRSCQRVGDGVRSCQRVGDGADTLFTAPSSGNVIIEMYGDVLVQI